MSQFFPPPNPLATLFHGSVTIEPGCDFTSDTGGGLYGFGDLFVSRQVQIGYNVSLPNSGGNSSGSLIVHGGMGVKENTYMTGTLTVMSTSNLKTTYMDTDFGGFYISGGSGIVASVGSAITMTTSVGDIKLNSLTDRVVLDSGDTGLDAIRIVASNSAGGIDMDTGQNSGMNISTGSLGLVGSSAEGPISLTANNGNGSFIVNAASNFKMLTLQMNGDYDTGILIDSASNNTSYKALQINTSNQAGKIFITNTSSGSHAGEIQILAGSGGLTANTNTGGSISILARDATSSFIVDTVSSGKDLTIGVSGATDSSLVLQSQGTGNDAILVNTTDPTGSIKILQTTGSGAINITTGSSGFGMHTQPGGGVNINANGASSSFINNTSAANQNLTVCVKGDTSSKLILCSEGRDSDGITIQSTGQSGGIFAVAKGAININSSSVSQGINIGTATNLPGVPINIGTLSSTTTINGNLDVRGMTTTYESEVVQIKDNIIQINNAPSGLADGGIAIKRYQSANDTCIGSVIGDTPEISGTVNSLTTSTISITGTGFNVSSDYYRGYWVKITIINGVSPNQTTSCIVRRVKASSTSSGTSGTLTIFTSADQNDPNVLNNVSPAEGLDMNASLGTSSTTFQLFPCSWIVSMWDESLKEYALVCSNFVSQDSSNNTTQIPVSHYINLHINNMIANALTIQSINGTTADVQFKVTLNNDIGSASVALNPTTSNVPIPNYPNYGVFIALVRPEVEVQTRSYAVFVIGRRAGNNCGQVARIISVKGAAGDMLDMSWPANSYPELFYRPAPGLASTVTAYIVKLITV
jgi:hypothetical protein